MRPHKTSNKYSSNSLLFWGYLFFLRWDLIKMKKKRKQKGSPLALTMKFCLSPLHKLENSRAELMYLLDPSGLTGLEPAASALTGRCSDQLNYNPREIRDLAEILILFIYVSGLSEGQGGSIILWWIGELLGRAGFEPA